jgi:membrane dipeptidase
MTMSYSVYTTFGGIRKMKDRIKNIKKQSIITDNAFGFEPEIEVNYKWDVIEQFRTSGFSHLSISIATDMTSLATTTHYLSKTTRYIENNSDKYILVKKFSDIAEAKKAGKLAISYMFQGSNPLEKNIDMVDVYKDLGVYSLLLSYNIQNAVGTGCTENIDSGLSIFGRALIKRMNNAGVLIDCSHTGVQTSLDAMEFSTAPVIFSHSNVKAIHDHPRNLTDEQIIACAATGGFIGINGNGPLLGEAQASIKKYVDHIDYVAQLVGVNHVGLGTDHVYFKEIFDDFMQKNSLVYPGNYGVGSVNTWHSISPVQIDEIILELINRDYSDEDISKIIGGNYCRVIQSTLDR